MCLALRLPSAALVLLAGCTGSPRVDDTRVLDLTHPFNESSVYWPAGSS